MRLPDDNDFIAPEDDAFIPPEDNEFCIALVKAVPALAPLMKKHLEMEEGELLSYMFLSEVARWAEENALTNTEDVRLVIDALNEGLETGEGDVPNLIAVGFGESPGLKGAVIPLLTGELREWYDYDSGITSTPPRLRSQ
ncbi:hypothetical protein G7068_04545 [Leucobacter viscericola]|uniref:DUF7674 domain-containing protein n=1 Tax=Leucobacter viscericola TaxID=2714935 RepID=A0A6G7XDV6_9MICO|nr:hypothetical protein [Leucobacter viscericola]QIK62558.1 hypothetical protein G7068_04545 [Leucobacter viscericola]